jgi:hypothetical protein
MNQGMVGWPAVTTHMSPTPISRIVVGRDVTSPTASVSFLNIPQNFSQLQFRILGRGDKSATNIQLLRCQFNGDTGSNYDSYLQMEDNSYTGVIVEAISAAFLNLTEFTASTAATNDATMCELNIPDYSVSGGFNKITSVFSTSRVATGSNNIRLFYQAGHWGSTDAIRTVTFLLESSANFIAPTSFTLYGIP